MSSGIKSYRELLDKYPSMREASRQTGIPYTTLQNNIKRELRQLEKPILPRVSTPYIQAPYVQPKLKKILAIYDTHDDPNIPKDRFRWMGYHAKHGRYDHIIHGGDLVDFLSLCTHVPNESYHGRFKGTYQDDLSSLNEALGLFQSESGNIPVRGVLGNHDIRAKLYETKFPETNGTMHHAFERVLKANNWDMLDYGRRLTVEGVDFLHTPFR